MLQSWYNFTNIFCSNSLMFVIFLKKVHTSKFYETPQVNKIFLVILPIVYTNECLQFYYLRQAKNSLKQAK